MVEAVSGVRGARIALQGVLLCAGWAEEPAEQAVLGILPLAQPDPPSLLEVHILELLTLSLFSDSPSPALGPPGPVSPDPALLWDVASPAL